MMRLFQALIVTFGIHGAVAVPHVAAETSHHHRSLEKDLLVVTSSYHIGPEDVLEISVWRNKDISKEVTVRPDGRISLPLIGDVQASGLTPTELTEAVTARLAAFMKSPTVSVIAKEVNSYSIYLMGQVANPGRYFLRSKTTLLQALTLAGGFAPLADRSRIIVLRWGGAGHRGQAEGQLFGTRAQGSRKPQLYPPAG